MKVSLIIEIMALIMQLYLGFIYSGKYLVGGLYFTIVLLWLAILFKYYKK